MSDALASFAELATRLVLDSISYSNPLPEWFDSYILDYDIQSASIIRRIEAYLSGRSAPAVPTSVRVPRRDGSTKQWLIPSVSDQIVLQVATSAIADEVRERSVLDRSRVFSYAPNADPARLALNESQFSSWVRFEHTTRERLAGVRMLQLDLESAFGSIEVASFLKFLRDLAPPAVDLLAVMLRVLSPTGRGLPRVNDSLFFLGNLYLRIIDDVVANHTSEWIRFVDDYRIFGGSDGELNDVLSGITRDLARLGFRPNPQKIRIGSEEEYLEAVEQIRYAKSTKETYVSAAVFDDVIEPSLLFELCRKAVDAPHELMHEGTGRYILQALRRMKTNSDIAYAQNQPRSPRATFRRLARDPAFFDRLGRLMLDFARGGDEWRLVWLLYFVNVLTPGQEQENDDIAWPEIPDAIRRLDPVLAQLSAMPDVTPIGHVWLRAIGSDRSDAPRSMETYYEMNYTDAGRYVGQQLWGMH